MTRSPRRGRSPIAIRARHLFVAGVGATLLVGLLATGAVNAATDSRDAGSTPHSALVVQRDATITIGASNTARSHRVVVTGAFFSVAVLVAIAAARTATARRPKPRSRGGSIYTRRRAPPSLLLVAR
jgi:hypothetical protein